MSLASVACIQKCLLTYARSGKEEFLEGTFSSVIERTDSLGGRRRGDDCGGGKMILRKVTTSDFYVEPFLRKKNTPGNNNPPLVKTNRLPIIQQRKLLQNRRLPIRIKTTRQYKQEHGFGKTKNRHSKKSRSRTDTRRQKRSYYKAQYKNPGSVEIKGKQSCANTSDKFRKCFSEII
jgi:hypothetical protein